MVKRGPGDGSVDDDEGGDGDNDDSDDRSRVGEERTGYLQPGIVCE